MNKGANYIDLFLQDPNCAMIWPWYMYEKDEHGIPIWKQKIQRNPDNLKKLEEVISTTMKTRHQQELRETLEKTTPILYIDCDKKKWTDDILFFIFKSYIQQSQAQNKSEIIGQIVWDNSIATSSRKDWKEHIKDTRPTTEEIIDQYTILLTDLLQANNATDKQKTILNMESHVAIDGIARLMLDENIRNMYLYLDNINSLTTDEQQRINSLLFARWALPHDRWINLKINNGNGSWKTWTTMSGDRTQATHDYSDITIREHELE